MYNNIINFNNNMNNYYFYFYFNYSIGLYILYMDDHLGILNVVNKKYLTCKIIIIMIISSSSSSITYFINQY